jgi:hypothetical protein
MSVKTKVVKLLKLATKGECTLWCTQFEGNLGLHIISKEETHKISLILNCFTNHI